MTTVRIKNLQPTASSSKQLRTRPTLDYALTPWIGLNPLLLE